jgi:peroxiredoxin
VTVEAGKTTTVTLGASGRQVTGTVQLPPEASGWGAYAVDVQLQTKAPPLVNPVPDDVRKQGRMAVQKWMLDYYKTDAGKAYLKVMRGMRYYGATPGADGKFSMDDVVPGDYTVMVTAYENGRGVFGRGQSSLTVTPVTPGSNDQPLDTGAIKMVAIKRIAVGDDAPDVSMKTLDGKDIKLSDYRGKFVLLELFATNSTNDVQSLKDVYAAHGTDPRFAMISESFVDADTTKTYVQTNAMNWTVAVIPDGKGAQWDTWVMGNLPVLFLIGPDGKLIARDLTADAIAGAVDKALANGP